MDNQVLNEENFMVDQPKLIGAVDRILIKKSIARRVSDVQPMKGPVGIVSGAKWNSAEGKITIEKKDITAITNRIRTEFTSETLQDLYSIYKEDIYNILAHYLVDEMSYIIDSDFIDMVKTRASSKTPIVFSGVDYNTNLWAVGQSISISVNKGLCDLPISDNRSPQGWAIVSSNVASLLAGTLNDSNPDGLNDESPSYLGRIAGVEYYIDYTHPNNGVDSVIFGIKGNGYSKGSTIYAPYTKQWIDTINPDNGEQIMFLLDRTGMAINPLDEPYYNAGAGISGFLGKFDVDLSDLQIFN